MPQSVERTHLEGVNVVREHNDLVASVLVVLDQELTGLELLWVHRVEQHALPRLLTKVLAVELWRHVAPHLRALHTGNVAVLSEVHPVGFVQFGSDQEVEVVDLVVLAHERC